MWPDNDLRADLWYLNEPKQHDHDNPDHHCWGDPCTRTVEGEWKLTLEVPGGGRLLVEYADSNGGQAGFANSFWFDYKAGVVPRPDWLGSWDADEPYVDGVLQPEAVNAAQMRVLAVLRACEWKRSTEVWT